VKIAPLGQFANGGAVTVDLARLLETRMLIQATSGYGKSWGLRRLIEITAGHVQQLVVDPEGEFPTLREKFDLVICSAQGGDALAHPRTAKLLAIRLLETRASAVLDLSELKAPDRHSFVRLFFESLIEAPKNLRHSVLIALDEAQMFCPEKGQGESEATDAVIDIASRGRKRGLSLLAATQRIGKFHKSAAAELKNKLIGSCSLDVDVKRAAFDLGIPPKEALLQLRALQPGHFYAFGPALNQVEPRELKVGQIVTSHPKVGHRTMAPPAPTQAIKALLPKLADLPKEAEERARSLEDLKRDLAAAKRELVQLRKLPPASAKLAAASSGAATIRRLKQALEKLMKFIIAINAAGFADSNVDPEALRKAIDSAVSQAMKLVDHKLTMRAGDLKALQREGGRLVAGIQKLLADETVEISLDVKHQEAFSVITANTPARAERKPPSELPATSSGGLPKGEIAILSACIQFPDGLRREQLTVLTGYKRSTRDTYVQRLGEKGFIEISRDLVVATENGRDALPDAQPLPTGEDLQRYWLDRLPQGERKILELLVRRHPGAIERDAITEQTGYKRSTRDSYLQRLDAKQLITEPARGSVAASEELFR
jgi:DNA-binding MarR family transcriptional regulator